jgi:plasmid replication initiation protein
MNRLILSKFNQVMEIENNSVVRVSNILNLTRQEFSVIEKHILHFVLNELKENQGFNLQNIDNELPLKVVVSASGILKNSMNKDALKDAVKKITSRNFFFDFSKTDSDYFGSVNPIPYAKYTSKKGQKSEILIEIHHSCKKLFLELAQGYTSLLLEAILNLKSEYSIRMYELMSMHLNRGTWTIKLEDFRTLLGLNNSKYKDFFQLKKFILEYSQKELWEHCGLHFDWVIAQKERKKVTALTFTITTKKKQEKVQVSADIKTTMDYIATLTPKDIAEKSHILMTQYTLSAEQKDYILSDTNVFNEFIRVHAVIENMIERSNPPKDRTKYLAKSLGLDKVKIAK